MRQNVTFVPSTRGNTVLSFPRTGLLQIVKSTVLFTSHIASTVKLNDNI